MKSISGKKLCRVVEKKGWKLARVKGSHYIFTHKNKEDILVIPVHSNKDIHRGLLKNIMKIANINESDL